MLEIGNIFVRGLIVGFSIAIVIGPIGLLCIHETLSYGFLAGFITGLGAATADGIFGALAGLGISIIMEQFFAHRFLLNFIGGLLLCFLGLTTARRYATAHTQTIQRPSPHLLRMYLSTCLLTLGNPMTLVTFSAALASLGITPHSARVTLVPLLFSGVFLGSACWWLILSGSISFFRSHLASLRVFATLNYLAGILIFLFGCAMVGHALMLGWQWRVG